MKVAIIRCNDKGLKCAGYNCFPAMQNRTGQFKGYDTIEIVGFDSCGGCGRNEADKILARALRLKEKGAEVIHFANCIVHACPFQKIYEKAMQEKVGLPLIKGSHPHR